MQDTFSRIKDVYNQVDALHRYLLHHGHTRSMEHVRLSQMCTQCFREISSYSALKIDNHEIFKKLKDIMQPIYLQFRYDPTHYDPSEIGLIGSVLRKTHSILWSDDSEQAMYTLRVCLWVQNIDLQKMNRITNGYNKCAMTLPREGPWEGSPAWFLQLWNLVLDEDRPRFCAEMGEALKLTGREKFCVSVRKGATHVVVFYVDVGLQELAQRTFRTVFQGMDALTQALDLLHNPHAEYNAFIARACDSHEDRGARHLMLRLSSLLAELG